MVTLKIKENDAQHALVMLNGELDTAAIEKFKEDITPLTTETGKELTLDFTELEYISSAGMRILLVLNKQAQAQNASLTITGMSEDIRQIFQMTGFDQMLDIK